MGRTTQQHNTSGIKAKHLNSNLNVDYQPKPFRSAPIKMKTHYVVSTGTNLPVIAECNSFTHIHCVTVCCTGKKWNKIRTFYCSLYSITSIFPLPLLPISILIIFPSFLSLLCSPLLVTHTPDKWPHIIIPSLYQHTEEKWVVQDWEERRQRERRAENWKEMRDSCEWWPQRTMKEEEKS